MKSRQYNENAEAPLAVCLSAITMARKEGAPQIHHNQANARELPLLTPTQCASEPPRAYVIKRLLARGDHACIIGSPGAGKSVLAPYIGHCVALGQPVFGHRTKAAKVLYLAAEDGAGMKMRFSALLERFGDPGGLLLSPRPLALLLPDGPDFQLVADAVTKLQPGLIILDTLASAFSGMEENDSRDMGRVVRVIRELSGICNSAFLTLHHPPKGDSKTARGHGILMADLDLALFGSEQKNGVRGISVGKNRNGQSDGVFSFLIDQAALGRDDDGDDVTAPIVDDTSIKRSAVTLQPAPSHALSILHDMMAKYGVPLPPELAAEPYTRGVRVKEWQAECDRQDVSTASKDRDRARAIREAQTKLKAACAVSVRDGWAWPIGRGGIGDQYRV